MAGWSTKGGVRCGNPAAARAALRAFYASQSGVRLREVEQTLLDEVLPTLFGYHLLQVGWPADADLLRSSRIGHRMVLDPDNVSGSSVHLASRTDSLPLASDSIDVILLPHLLELERHPHEVLREVERTLIPEGHVVILGFNPWSLWGACRLLPGRKREVPWCGHFYSQTRIRDWLALLGFATVRARTYFYRPPLRHGALMERLELIERLGARWWGPLGGGYLLVARKRVTALTPIRPRWRSRRGLIRPGLTEPTTRTVHDDQS